MPAGAPRQLEGETLIESRSSSVAPTRERMGAYYRKLGLGKNPVVYTDSFSNVVMMVETGIGVAIVPSNLRNRLFAGLCFAELEGPWQQMEFVALCMPDNPNPCAGNFCLPVRVSKGRGTRGRGGCRRCAPRKGN